MAATIFASGLIAMTPAAAAPTAAPMAAPTAAPAATCPVVFWGSLPKTDGSFSTATVRDVRTGRHACFDRLVVDLNGRDAGYSVKYVNNVYKTGSGERVHLRGGAKLSIVVYAPAYDEEGNSTYLPDADITTLNYTTFRQLAYLGSFEGQTEWGLSTRARLPMRVFTLDGPGTGSRVVIDVAHHWR